MGCFLKGRIPSSEEVFTTRPNDHWLIIHCTEESHKGRRAAFDGPLTLPSTLRYCDIMEPPSLIYRTEKGHRTKTKPLGSELTQEKIF